MIASMEEVRRVPKIELHAHLSGSITQAKLVELLKEQGETFTPFDVHDDISNSLAKCFDYFDRVTKVVTNLEKLHRCTLHVLETFASEYCMYLELRTSPKQLKSASGEPTTKLDYLKTVETAVKEFQASANEKFKYVMQVKILLSLDRGKVKCKEDALKQIDDIAELSKASDGFVVGVDVCGNPSTPSVVPYVIPAMLERKEVFAGLPVTFHTAEHVDDVECDQILENMGALNIRRLGHVCYLPTSVREKLFAGGVHSDGAPVGIELCPTSNRVTCNLESLKDHHFLDWWRKSENVLVSVNSDDIGLFSCTLTGELTDMATSFDLSLNDILYLQEQAIKSSFHPDKAQLLASFQEAVAAASKVPPSGEALES